MSSACHGPPELDVNDAGMAELVIASGLCQGPKGCAAEVKVVLGDRVVVHVGDRHRLWVSGAHRVVEASYLKRSTTMKGFSPNRAKSSFLSVYLCFHFHEGGRQHKKACRHPRNSISDQVMYLVARATTLAILEQGLVAARRHGRERRLVHVLEPASSTCMHRSL